jgi:hypothetical protein
MQAIDTVLVTSNEWAEKRFPQRFFDFHANFGEKKRRTRTMDQGMENRD